MAEVVKKNVVASYELKITQEEAETLRMICNNIAGSPETSRRKHTDAINRALRIAGVEVESVPHVGQIRFDNHT